MELVYKNEKSLFVLMLVFSILFWLLLLVSTRGVLLVYLPLGFLFYCFAQSALISYIKGTGVRISADQFPDIHGRIADCAQKLGLAKVPDAYVLQMGGALNAFATRFLGRDFLVLYSDVVDGMADNPDALNFYIGHEIGHIKRKHLSWSTVLMPASVLPLIGAAYSRAREYTCDRHGLAACAHPLHAEHGLAVLAAGGKRSRSLNTQAYIDQGQQTQGFWMSFHELVSDYPWLVKRMAAVRALGQGHEVQQPSRSKLAGILALFMPRLGLGGGGGLATLMTAVALIGILAAVAVPAYQNYTQKADAMVAYEVGQAATRKVGAYYMAKQSVPASLSQAGVMPSFSPAVGRMRLDPESAVLRVELAGRGGQGKGALVFTPSIDEQKGVVWECTGEDLSPQVLPDACQ